MPNTDEFDVAQYIERAKASVEASLKGTESRPGQVTVSVSDTEQMVTARAQLEALVSIANSLRRIESRLCEKAD